jgi:hypothetical protein
VSKKFPKDAWIKSALKAGYLIVERDGTIWRRTSASADGKRLSSEIRMVKVQIHKPTGRVYFNLTWLGFTKSVLVNRVVAWAFLPNPENLPQVNHIDGDKENNAVANLEWSSASDNEKHAHRTGLKSGRGSANANAKLTADDVIAIRDSKADIAELMERFGVARSTILNVQARKTWAHI